MGQRDERGVGEHAKDLDSTKPTGTSAMGQSKSNLVFKPLPLVPETTAGLRPPCATSGVGGFSPQRRLAGRTRSRRPCGPAPREGWRGHGDPKHKGAGRAIHRRSRAAGDPAGRTGERGKALALPRRAPLRLRVVLPLAALRDAGPPCGCGVPAAAAPQATRRALSRGYRPFAHPALRHRLHAPRVEPQCALGCRVLAGCGALGCGGRRPATPLSRAGGEAGRGAGAATSQPGIRPSALPQLPETPPPNRLTSSLPVPAAQRPPVSAGGNLRTTGQS